jgi:ferric-dicitrate binding protein FerR (iron transport regulator)
MDPITAFAAAQAAVAGIQKAIKLGKDINGLVGEFGKFFDAKDVVQKAANDKAKKGQSDTGKAMEIVMQANALREAEEALKHQLVYGGYPELWEMMLKERMKIKQERAKAERAAKIERRRVMAQRLLAAQIIGGAIAVILIGGIIIFIIRQAMA